MTAAVPGNGNETAYLAFALIDELIDLLVRKGVVTNAEIADSLGAVVVRLGETSNHDAKRASQFLAGWIKSDPEIE